MYPIVLLVKGLVRRKMEMQGLWGATLCINSVAPMNV
jgi:hypothetical protein